MKQRCRRKGFTLGEMVTTIAIVGTLTAVAVPSYLRIKMHVGMEMVQQHLKTVQKHMNDLLNRNRQFPQDINNLGNSDEEVAITASLTAIDSLEYTTDGYEPLGMASGNVSDYRLRTCPKAGRVGISGDKCFTVNPMGISFSVALVNPADAWSPAAFGQGWLRKQWRQEIQMMNVYKLQSSAYMASYGCMRDAVCKASEKDPSSLFFAEESEQNALIKFVLENEAYMGILKDVGITLEYSQQDTSHVLKKTPEEGLFWDPRSKNKSLNSSQLNLNKVLEVKFKLEDPVNSVSEYWSRLQQSEDTYYEWFKICNSKYHGFC